MDQAAQLGVVRKKEDRFYDLFRNRLIFPIFARNGKDVLGFGARALDDVKGQNILIVRIQKSFIKEKLFMGGKNLLH